MPIQASQATEHMSRRAASIEPEDGECTPSPSAVQQAPHAARHHAMPPPSVMQTLPPPPPDSRFQVKVHVSWFGSYVPPCRVAFHMPLLHLAFLCLLLVSASCCPTQGNKLCLQDGYAHKLAGPSASAKAKYSAHYPDTSLPPPPRLH